MSDPTLCPFSKPIIGCWCRCEYARVSDRCAGKMVCKRASVQRRRCVKLSDLLKERARFVVGVSESDPVLTHAQSMKIRCGGLTGMRRVLAFEADKPPRVVTVIDAVEERYGSLDAFPFNEIVQDIRSFSHRRKRSDKKDKNGAGD